MNSMATTQDNTGAVYLSDPQRWAAVMRRDPQADGQFYYAVRTTGVYCRPSCPSRHALRDNVTFHESPAAAEEAGYRPCKRCHPNEARIATKHGAAVAKACRLIEAADELPSLETLANAAGMSQFHFHRVFKAATGVTPKAYAAAHRTRRVREELPRSETVTDAIYNAGFNSAGRFYATSASVLGMTPTTYRAGGIGAEIRFAVGQCALGSILVAATAQGICAISLGDDPDALVRELQDRFPQAQLHGGDRDFEHWMAKVVAFVEAPGSGLDLPLDVRGTAFQQRVWQALQKIPAGSTASYTEIAERIGAPTAARAVARACALNTIAVAIPCHRVVRTDGSLSGYRWGVARKRSLLERESPAK
jgi:AraC family transcriptional regulator of adaptative response/methylated-DNA-[protein]-cysteine methyltransferase